MSTLEIEVKFFLADMELVRRKLQQSGAESDGRLFETNICFENAAKDLHVTRSLLRLRKDNKTTLTYKTKPTGNDAEFKVLQELEVAVSDFDTMVNILKALGYHQDQIYEKYRETFTLGSTNICLDGIRQREQDLLSHPSPAFGENSLAFMDSTDAEGNKVFPTMNIDTLNWYTVDPQFVVEPTNQEALLDFMENKWDDNSDIDWSFEPEAGFNQVWPLPENLAYADVEVGGKAAGLHTAGMGGFHSVT